MSKNQSAGRQRLAKLATFLYRVPRDWFNMTRWKQTKGGTLSLNDRECNTHPQVFENWTHMNEADLTLYGPTEDIHITREWNSVQICWEISIKNIPGGDIIIFAENCPRLIIT